MFLQVMGLENFIKKLGTIRLFYIPINNTGDDDMYVKLYKAN